jgi:AcrR family transcriptional regulator
MAKVYKRRLESEQRAKKLPPARQRNAGITRAAILISARHAFAQAGYDGVGVRQIAEGAGVTAMLVNRYFGSKEQLFAEVVADVMSTPAIITEEIVASPTAGNEIATALVNLTAGGNSPLDGFRITLHSASSPSAAKIGREQIEAHHHKVLTAALRGDHAAERAALVLSIVAGVQVMRQMIGLTALTECPPTMLVKLLGPVFQQLMDVREPSGTTARPRRAQGPRQKT